MQEDRDLRMAERIARKVREAGGDTYFVGGLVRDRLLGRDCKDIDIEIHKITPGTLRELLGTLGEVTSMGASFGILGLRGYDVDIAMPRSETATGRGHKDFDVFVDPFLGPEKAALRRDFTINALMEDVLTGEVLDFFGGIRDLNEGLIRHVNDETFAEDPLRVLRGAQFAARFGFKIAPETVHLAAGMDLCALPGERIFGELEKALLKAARPSVFFNELRGMGQLDRWFPEVEALAGVPQNPFWHPEGDVWNHTMQVLDHAAALRDQSSEPLDFMLAALCHDFGKAETTEVGADGKIHAYGHEDAGKRLADVFLSRMTKERRLKRYVLNMVGLHMRPNQLADQKTGIKSSMYLFDASVCPEDLLLLAKADRMGRLAAVRAEDDNETFLRQRLAIYQERMERPHVLGRDLADAGVTPGPAYSRALEFAHKLRLAGIDKEEALKQTLAFLKQDEPS